MPHLPKAQRQERDARITQLCEEQRLSAGQIAWRLAIAVSIVEWVILRDGLLHPTKPLRVHRRLLLHARGKYLVRSITPDEDALLLQLSTTGASATRCARLLAEHGYARSRVSIVARLCALARHAAYSERQAEGATC